MKTGRLFMDFLGWGLILWLLGYILGIILFMLVRPEMIGWIITPFASLFTFWILVKKIRSSSLQYFAMIGIAWCCLAVLLDYLFIVKLLKPADGYYKPDVYIYYAITLLLPLVVGFKKRGSQ